MISSSHKSGLTKQFALATVLYMFASTPALAQASKVSPSTGLLQIFAALAFVIALMLVLAWLFKRVGPLAGHSSLPLKIVGGLNLGNREKLLVVEVADQWLVLGVTAQQITKLSELPKQELPTQVGTPTGNQFADWLKKTIDKRNQAPN